MFCTKCGAKLEDNANFCPVCGQKIVREKELRKSTEAVPVQEQDLTNEAMAENGQVQQAAEDSMMEEPVAETVLAGATPALVKEETSIPNPDSIHTKSEKPFEIPDSQPQTSDQTPVSHNDAPQQAPLESAPAQKKPPVKLIAIAVAIVIVLIIIVASVLKSYNSPSNKFSRAMGQEDYITASTLYSALDSTEQQKALKTLTELAWDEVMEYSKDATTYEGVADWLDTLENLFPALKTYTGYAPDVRDQLDNLKQVNDHLANANAAEGEGDIPLAITEYGAAVSAGNSLIDDFEIDTDEMTSKITTLEENYKSGIFEDAKKKADGGDYEGAVAILKESKEVLNNDEEIEALISDYLSKKNDVDVTALLSKAKGLADGNDLAGAISLLDNTKLTDSKISSQLAEYKTTYESSALEEAAALAEEGKYEEAVAQLTSATTVIGDTDGLIKKIEEYTDKFPVELGSIDYYSIDPSVSIRMYDTSEEDDNVDVLGNHYVGYIMTSQEYLNSSWSNVMARSEEKGEVEYLLNGKYKELTGTLYLPYEARAVENPEIPSLFKVYGDGILLYTAPDFRKGVTDPVDFSIDISGTKVLKIAILGRNNLWSETMIAAANLTLHH